MRYPRCRFGRLDHLLLSRWFARAEIEIEIELVTGAGIGISEVNGGGESPW